MSRRIEILALVLGDALATAAVLGAVVWGAPGWDWIPTVLGSRVLGESLLVLAWVLLFAFSGLYAERYARGRLDELATLVKVVIFGCLALLFGLVVDRLEASELRTAIGLYALAQFGAVGTIRLAVRAVQRALVSRWVW